MQHVRDGCVVELPLVALLPAGPQPVSLTVDPQAFQPPLAWRAAMAGPVAEMRAHPDRHDGTLTALVDLQPGSAGGFHGRLAPVSYFHTRALESLLDGPLDLRSHDQAVPGRLPSPARSLLACDIGVVVILQTSDGFVVAQRRSEHLDWRPGCLSASASGSLEPGRDFQTDRVGLSGLVAGARRELAEELGVGGPADPARAALTLTSLGIWRELERGGKPELYTRARTPLCFEQVRALHASAPDAHESEQLTALAPHDVEALLAPLTAGGPSPALDRVDLALVAGLLLAGPAPG